MGQDGPCGWNLGFWTRQWFRHGSWSIYDGAESRDDWRRCWRASTNSSALMASNSAAVFLNFRPAWTRGRIASSQSAGIVSTRFLPAVMKVSVASGWPSPFVQWQEGFPQRRWETASEPGGAWLGGG